MARKRKTASDSENPDNINSGGEPEQIEQTAFEMGNIVVEGGDDTDGFSLLEEYSDEIEESGNNSKSPATALTDEDGAEINLSDREDFLKDNGVDPEDAD